VFADMVAYAKGAASATSDPELQQIIDRNRQIGSLMQEREILVGIDL
jgi:hypothetical protein